MQKTIYACDHCNDEIRKQTHLSLNVAGNGNTSGIAVVPAQGDQWKVHQFPRNFMHFHLGCLAPFFRDLRDNAEGKKPKK